jgi:VanZ family protein
MFLVQIRILRKTVQRLFSRRFLASILAVLMMDVATFLAVSKGSGVVHFFPHFDKILHISGLCGLTVMGFLALSFDWSGHNRDSYFWLGMVNGVFWLLYGAGIEWVHLILPYRQASFGDFFADAIGVGLGLWLVWTQKLFPEVELDS